MSKHDGPIQRLYGTDETKIKDLKKRVKQGDPQATAILIADTIYDVLDQISTHLGNLVDK